VILFATISVHALEIRGAVAGEFRDGTTSLVDGNSFTWNPQNFAGFYYDIDHDVGAETLTTTLAWDRRLSGDDPYGITYTTTDQMKALSNALVDMTYGKLRVASIDSATGKIVMDNKDNAITLSKNKNTEIMPGIYIRTADNDTLRYYIYKNITDPGTYEIRGSVAGTFNDQSNLDPADNSFTWNPQNFAGFYYDIKKDLGTETLTTTLTGDDGRMLSGDYPRGIIYTTSTQSKAFERALWGSYRMIGFQAERYFAGYIENTDDEAQNMFYKESTDKNSLSSEQLEKILMDEKTNMLVKKGESIKLKEGYELVLKGVNSNGQAYLELLKDGKIVNEAFIAPFKVDATEYDKTYFYRKDVGEQKNLVIIAVHFRSTYKDEEQAVAAVDGIWQISDMPIDVRANTQYGKMVIRSVDGTNGVITMDNKDNTITLTRKSDIGLMPGINIRTADNEILRYYIYRTVTVL